MRAANWQSARQDTHRPADPSSDLSYIHEASGASIHLSRGTAGTSACNTALKERERPSKRGRLTDNETVADIENLYLSAGDHGAASTAVDQAKHQMEFIGPLAC